MPSFCIPRVKKCPDKSIISQEDKKHGPKILPELPANARYIYHENRCYDLGTVGWAIENGAVDTSLYRFIILMNSSSRGPFFPRYHAVSRTASCLSI